MKREHDRDLWEVRKWYRTKRWYAMRDDVLRANPYCVHCQEAGRVTAATEVDHIRKHAGSVVLFWDRANLQGLCKAHHASKTAKGE